MGKDIIHKRVSFKCDASTDPILEKFATVIGAKQILNDPGLSLHQTGDGTLIQIFGTGACYPDNIFDKGHTVMSFRVGDLAGSVEKLVAEGATLIDDIIRPCGTYAYCHLALTDDIIVGLYQEG